MRRLCKPVAFMLTASALISALALAGEPQGILHLPLAGNAQDTGPNHLELANQGVQFETPGPRGEAGGSAAFDGRGTHLETAGLPALGTGDFSIALWVHTDEILDDDLGDIVAQYDPVRRVGFHLSLRNNTGVTSCQANTRQLQFGIDAGSEPTFRAEGRPGNALLAFALAVHDGALYAGTCEPGKNQSGHVYRHADGGRWTDLGAPDRSNAVTALTAFRGQLYVGTSKYRVAGSALPESENGAPGGRVFRLEDDGRWSEAGSFAPQHEAIGGLVVYRGELYASSLYKPAGLFRYQADGKWTSLPTPAGLRVESLTVFNGALWASSYDGGYVFRFDGSAWSQFSIGDNTQTYSFAIHNRQLHVATWPSGRVYRMDEQDHWQDAGRLGEELEVMGMLVHNGKLYGGTLPLAAVFRHDGQHDWTRLRQLDHTPDVKYRRAWTMAQYRGRLFVSTLPSGDVYSMEAGKCVTHDHELAPGWRHVAAIRAGKRLRLFVDGEQVAESTELEPAQFDLTTAAPLWIGHGAGDCFKGRMADLRIYRGALSAVEIKALARR